MPEPPVLELVKRCRRRIQQHLMTLTTKKKKMAEEARLQYLRWRSVLVGSVYDEFTLPLKSLKWHQLLFVTIGSDARHRLRTW